MGTLYKETSRLALASIYCVLAAIASIILFCLFVMVGIDCGHFISASILFSAVGFILGIIALFVIAFRHKESKGYVYAILAIILATPFMLAMASSIYVARVRAERRKANTGLYNLRVLGEALTEYAEDHNGYLPAAGQWCDLLMEHDGDLTKDNFKFPKPERLQLKGNCHFAFNKNLGGLRLVDIPADVVLLFEADGDWNLSGGAELLKTRYKGEHSSIAMLFTDQTIRRYWYYKEAVRKFDSKGTRMYYEPPCWKP